MMKKSSCPICFISACLLSACNTTADQISNFDNAVTTTTIAVRSFYVNLDSFRRRSELTLHKYKAFEKLSTTDKDGNQTDVSSRYDDKKDCQCVRHKQSQI